MTRFLTPVGAHEQEFAEVLQMPVGNVRVKTPQVSSCVRYGITSVTPSYTASGRIS